MENKSTILIYADGNNDLEPEVYQSYQLLTNEPIEKDVNVVVQLARAPQSLVTLFRPNIRYANPWDGVRRYQLHTGHSDLLMDLGNPNMAHSTVLSDFITWGVENYPADHVMLILSGHGAGFLGLLTDFTHSSPSIMTIKGLSSALSEAKRKTGKKIDVVVLDACFMNMVEIWVEIAFSPECPVKYLIAPSGFVPLEGLPLNRIIHSLQNVTYSKISRETSLENTLNHIVSFVNQNGGNILSVKLEKQYFTELKKQVNLLGSALINVDLNSVLGSYYDNRPDYPLLSLVDCANQLYRYLSNIDHTTEFTHITDLHNITVKLKDTLKHVILSPFISQIPKHQNMGPSLYCPTTNKEYMLFSSYYDSLKFSQENAWVKLISHRNAPIMQSEESPLTMQMPLESIVQLILQQNVGMTKVQALKNLQDLGWYK